jgi:hypothetical protein
MRKLLVVCATLLLASAAFSQVMVLSGYATNQGWGGYYPSAPFVPLVTTPSVSLNALAPSAPGASNATAGMTAGATNATLSIIQPSVSPVYTVPVWSGYDISSQGAPVAAAGVEQAAPVHIAAQPQSGARHIELGVSSMESDLAPYAKVQRQHEHATRVFTNSDIDRINQQNGTVKYGGKVEHIGS